MSYLAIKLVIFPYASAYSNSIGVFYLLVGLRFMAAVLITEKKTNLVMDYVNNDDG